MVNSRSPNEKYNESGYADGTAYLALQNIKREERKKIISELKAVANKYGYRIISTIELKEIEGDLDAEI